jgi:cobalt-zinc-cadmium efflux system outer membrane protein
MRAPRLLFLSGLLLSGCLYHARDTTDQTVRDLAARSFDLTPSRPSTIEWKGIASKEEAKTAPAVVADVQTTAYLQARPADPQREDLLKKRLEIPEDIPGGRKKETPEIDFSNLTPEQKRQAIRELYGPLPPLPAEPAPQPGPGGKPYTLTDLQRIAAENSWALNQAAADVEAARGNLIKARAYPNPKLTYSAAPSSDNTTSSIHGLSVDQVVNTAGKIKLGAAAAEMDLRIAELALTRARSDLATAVRNAYFALLVAKETVKVNKALARFTEEVYRVQVELNETGLGAAYEPAAVRFLAVQARINLQQAITTYMYAWVQMAATMGLRQLPLTEVAGSIDAFIPFYDFDAVRDHILRNHTDVLTARDGIDKARYNFKLAQITPASDVEFILGVQKDFAVPPQGITPSVSVGFTLPVWDHNRGGIYAADAALVRASEEPHRVETTLVNNLAGAYLNYKNNIIAVEQYRRYILPDQIRTYRGTRDRFNSGQGGAVFGDVVAAQQTLAGGINNYLTALGNLWTSVVGVADFLQTDDLFQLAKPLGVSRVPELEPLPPWPCGHPSATQAPAVGGVTMERGKE